ncbi:unnamed protein product (macronuclear) [Paramecium tetraurelia]|uniref:Leucine Rich Repeat family protein n=1 Tax=Paramecium tetraurelia TaxID=5888 RepID=A0DD06_PARTE|nr:uncharacterized protein GSPATT00015782001 [Paramecium tetraurelia]CAK80923.1 unnamed protein product [Paramecium tetraurelia]|eukprot:XP_001448320.1 hypothetical protein (macronuclear) [Paramecium tetraurelia strain d4-2]
MRSVKSANSRRPMSTIPKAQSQIMEIGLSPQIRRFVPSMHNLLETLYAKKCEELKIQLQPDQMARFQEKVLTQYQGHTIDLSELSLPANCIPLINKVVKNIPFVVLSQNPLYDGIRNLQLPMVSLTLCNCGIGPRGLAVLFQTLSINQTLYNLNIGNPFSNERNRLGLALNQLAEALKKNRILAILDISGCGIYDLRKLNSAFAENRNLLHINVSDNELKDALILPPYLERLEAQNNMFGQQVVQICEQLRQGSDSVHAREINLKRNKLTIHHLFAILEQIERNTHLNKLTLDENTFIGENNICICNYLVYNNHLEYLSLRNCSLTQNFIEQLASGLCRNGSLKTLDISKNIIGDQGALALVQGFQGSCNLKSIVMKRCGLTDLSGLELFKTFLKSNIQEYDFSNNLMGDQTAMYAIQLIKKNKDIIKMSFKKNLNSYETNQQIEKLLYDNIQDRKRNVIPHLRHKVQGMTDYREQQDFVDKKKEQLSMKKTQAESDFKFAQSQVVLCQQGAKERTQAVEERLTKLREEAQQLTTQQLNLDKFLWNQIAVIEDEQKLIADNIKNENASIVNLNKQIQDTQSKSKSIVQFYKQQMENLRLQDGITKRKVDQLQQEYNSVLAQFEFVKKQQQKPIIKK